jgi:hypothetical protein
VGDLINLLLSFKEKTEFNYPKRNLNLANKLVQFIISGYKNFYIASKLLGKEKNPDIVLENFQLASEKRVNKLKN